MIKKLRSHGLPIFITLLFFGCSQDEVCMDADLVLVDLEKKTTVTKDNLLYQCGWSPFEGTTFDASIEKTWVNGQLVYDQGEIIEAGAGEQLTFSR